MKESDVMSDNIDDDGNEENNQNNRERNGEENDDGSNSESKSYCDVQESNGNQIVLLGSDSNKHNNEINKNNDINDFGNGEIIAAVAAAVKSPLSNNNDDKIYYSTLDAPVGDRLKSDNNGTTQEESKNNNNAEGSNDYNGYTSDTDNSNSNFVRVGVSRDEIINNKSNDNQNSNGNDSSNDKDDILNQDTSRIHSKNNPINNTILNTHLIHSNIIQNNNINNTNNNMSTIINLLGNENDSLTLCSFFFCEERHYHYYYSLLKVESNDNNNSCNDDNESNKSDNSNNAGLVSKWRMKDRMKTVAVAVALCLNIGVDPPDVIRISPCAKMQCWMDPMSLPPQKSLEQIGKRLQHQYERWQPRARYKTSLDPTFEDIRKLCASCRRHAKGERVLFHYNGHGVPKPTSNGELWVFNSSYTQYIPLSVYDLQTWLQAPAIYIFDCSNAGVILNAFVQFAEQRCAHEESMNNSSSHSSNSKYQRNNHGQEGNSNASNSNRDYSSNGNTKPNNNNGSNTYHSQSYSSRVGGKRLLQDSIVLAACGAKERLPQDASLPADIFTACLTTPIKAALWWFCERSLLKDEGITQELVDRIPGRQTDRKTPLGELNWIFTAITDTIAWNMLPRALFQRLFRQDLLVASLFRNYLLAERVLQSVGCTPVSYPELPATYQHTMWSAWDMAAEGCLAQLPNLLNTDSNTSNENNTMNTAGAAGAHNSTANRDSNTNTNNGEYVVSPFFSQQLQAFEVWLQHGHPGTSPPEQLPIVLQVLLSQSHRLKALLLLGRFLDMGPWAVDLALSVGIFPYVLKLLQTTAADLRQILIFIWAKILALDRKCQVDLTKDNGHEYFVRFLEAPDVSPAHQSMAAFCLASIMDNYPRGKAACASAGVMGICLMYISTALSKSTCDSNQLLLLRWLCLCLGKLWEDASESQMEAMEGGAPDTIAPLLQHPACQPEVRAAAIFALGHTVHLPIARDYNSNSDHNNKQNNSGTESVPDTPPHSSGPSSVAASNNGTSLAFDQQPSSAPANSNNNNNGNSTSVRRVSTSGGQEVSNVLQHAVDLHNNRSTPAVETLETTTRLAAERSVALHIVASVPDGSPLVRQEVAVFLGRFVLAHKNFMRQVIESWLSSHKRYNEQSSSSKATSSKTHHRLNQLLDTSSILHRKPATLLSNSHSDVSGDASTPITLAHSISPIHSGPNLSLSSVESANGSNFYHQISSNNLSVQAYSRILDGLVALVMDPFPPIALAAKAFLNLIGIDIENYVMPRMNIKSSHSAFTSKASSPQAANNNNMNGRSNNNSQDSSMLSLNRRTFISRLPSLIRTPTATSMFSSASISPTNASSSVAREANGSSPLSNNNNNAFVHHRAQQIADGSNYPQSKSPISNDNTPSANNDILDASQWSNSPVGWMQSSITPETLEKLPKSTIYNQSCRHFCKPLWDTRRSEVPSTQSRWIVPSFSKFRTTERRRRANESAERCRMSRISRFSDIVGNIQLNNFGPATAMIFSVHEPLMCCASKRGDLSIWNIAEGSLANRFHLGSTKSGNEGAIGVKAPSPASSLHIINEFDSPMLAVGSCDGCIRVWRDPFGSTDATLVTAWQASPLPSSSRSTSLLSPSENNSSKRNSTSDNNSSAHHNVRAFQWQQHTGLFLVGGTDKRVRVWDVCKERCLEVIDGQIPAGISSMSASESSGTSIVVGYDNGALQHFDLRDPYRVSTTVIAATGHAVVSSAILGSSTQVVVGHKDGILSTYDLRKGISGGDLKGMRALMQLQAHSSGMLAMAVHQHANIITTSSNDSVIKVWNQQNGTLISTMRQQGTYMNLGGLRGGSASLLTMHPYKVLLAASSSENNVINLYGGDGYR